MAGYVTSGGRGQFQGGKESTYRQPRVDNNGVSDMTPQEAEKFNKQNYEMGQKMKPPSWEDISSDAMKRRMTAQAEKLMNVPPERFSPSQLQAGHLMFTPTSAASVGVSKGVDDYYNAIAQAERAAQQTDYIDPRMQQYLQQSMALNQGVLAGTAPSLATSQLRAGVDESIRAQMAMAASGGMNPAAMRGAQQQGAISLQQAANQASAIRAQEIAQARAAQQAAYENAAQMTLAGSQFQTQAQQNALAQYLGARESYAAMQQERLAQNAQLQQQANLQNQQLNMQTRQFNVQNVQDIQRLNEAMRAQEFEQYMTNQYNRQALASQLQGTVLTGQNAAAQLQAQRQMAYEQRQQQKESAYVGAGSTLAAASIAAFSDQKQKKNIKQNNETLSFLNALTDNSYEYKDTSLPGTKPGRQYGPMAQDLAKTKMGKSAIIETDQGMMVDTTRAMLLALSGLSNINARLNKLEGNKRA